MKNGLAAVPDRILLFDHAGGRTLPGQEAKFGILRDDSLGNTSGGHCRACLLEVEFLDVTAVDVLLNTGPNATAVRSEIAKTIAGAIINDLEHP